MVRFSNGFEKVGCHFVKTPETYHLKSDLQNAFFMFPVLGSPLYRFRIKNRQTKKALATKQAIFIWNGFRLWVAEGSTKNVKLQFFSLSSLFTLNLNILRCYYLLCILTSKRMLAHCVYMVENNENHEKSIFFVIKGAQTKMIMIF